jgi:hypothetical protein
VAKYKALLISPVLFRNRVEMLNSFAADAFFFFFIISVFSPESFRVTQKKGLRVSGNVRPLHLRVKEMLSGWGMMQNCFQ